MQRILCLYLPNWPIQRLLAARNAKDEVIRTKDEKQTGLRPSSFALRPLLLHARDPRRGDLVVAHSAAAHERGVRLGMPLTEAAALVDKYEGRRTKHETRNKTGHQLHPSSFILRPLILPHDPAADLSALAHLAEHCERFSPIVGWETAEGPRSKVQSPKFRSDLGPRTLDFGPLTGPDCLFLDVTGIGVLFGGEEHLAREVVVDMAKLGYEARVAIADTVGAAWATAKYEGPGTKDEKQAQTGSYPFAVLTSDFVLRPSSFVLSPTALRLPEETIDLLAELGITRLDQLLALPRESLRSRFGERLLLRINQWLGAAQEMIVAHRPPPQFVEEWLPEYPAERRDIIEQIVRELVRRVATDLANRREGVLKLACRLDCAPGRPHFLEIGLFRPSADAAHLWDLVRMQLEQAALPGPVGRVRLEATLTAPLENRQGELFAAGEHQAARQFALLVDRCSSRLGPEGVLCPELTADPLPERAVRYRRSTRGKRRTKDEGRRTKEAADLLRPSSLLLRPLSLFSPPLPIAAVSIAPDGPPISFQLQGQRYEIADQSGPERIETGWWRGRSVRRDYWRVETTTGQRFWLFRNLGDGKWQLHGEYA